MLRIKELTEHLKISKPTIYDWMKNGMPVHYVGKIPFFDLTEVENWIKAGDYNAAKRTDRL